MQFAPWWHTLRALVLTVVQPVARCFHFPKRKPCPTLPAPRPPGPGHRRSALCMQTCLLLTGHGVRSTSHHVVDMTSVMSRFIQGAARVGNYRRNNSRNPFFLIANTPLCDYPAWRAGGWFPWGASRKALPRILLLRLCVDLGLRFSGACPQVELWGHTLVYF